VVSWNYWQDGPIYQFKVEYSSKKEYFAKQFLAKILKILIMIINIIINNFVLIL